MTVFLRVFRTRAHHATAKVFRDTVAEAIEYQFLPAAIALAEETTENWKVPPEWGASVYISQRGIETGVLPLGDSAEIWYYLNAGVRPRRIVPKPGRMSLNPKHAPALRFPGPGPMGVGRGNIIFRQSVNWPGIKPRNYEAMIYNKSIPLYRRIVENAIRRALRRMQS